MKITSIFASVVLFFVVMSCSKDENYEPVIIDEEPQISPVVFNIDEVPYATLSEYNFFEGNIANQEPVYGVLPYDLITPLFSDYAKKKRFIWMPEGVKATYNGDHNIFDFADGAVMIKTFYYDDVLPNFTKKILETRLIIKKNDTYVFANYIWNDDQTEAVLNNNGRFVDVTIEKDGAPYDINYRIPSEVECFTCHKSVNQTVIPIGPKPQHLNKNFAYQNGIKNQIQKWIDMGYLDANIPSNITTVVNWEDESADLTLRARSYLDINCAHCHSDGAHCDYRPIRLAFEETEDPTNAGICVNPDEQIDNALIHIVVPGRFDRSVLWFRLDSTEPQYRMPLMGRSVKHEEGLALIETWINSLDNSCE
jgi:uncharacterized repeat protein (TIGR03806 family)